ncbi:MAG: hypothetical protein PGMFKBFP_02407 [Anaerolineales bacterium]|nr:hypothetical protein [Anaerolineales bacterium]
MLSKSVGMAEQSIVGFSSSTSVNFTLQVWKLPYMSVTVIVTKIISPCADPNDVPASGLWMIVSMPQLSVATTSETRSGTSPEQSPVPFDEVGTLRSAGQVTITGFSTSRTVTVNVHVSMFPWSSPTLNTTTVTVSTGKNSPLFGPDSCVSV